MNQERRLMQAASRPGIFLPPGYTARTESKALAASSS